MTKKIGTTRQKKKIDPQQAVNDYAAQLQAQYQAQSQSTLSQAYAGLAQAIDPNAVIAGGSAPVTNWGNAITPNTFPNLPGNQLNQQWQTPYQQTVGTTYPGFNPLDFITDQQKDELASMLLKKVLKAISDDDKEMLRKLLRGKI